MFGYLQWLSYNKCIVLDCGDKRIITFDSERSCQHYRKNSLKYETIVSIPGVIHIRDPREPIAEYIPREKIIKCKGVPYKMQMIRPRSGRDGYKNGQESATKHIYHSALIEPRNARDLSKGLLGEPGSMDFIKCAGMYKCRTKISVAVSEAQYDYIKNTN